MDHPNDASAPAPPSAIDEPGADATLRLFGEVCDLAASILESTDDWSASGLRDGQYSVDVEIDRRCRGRLAEAGVAVLSEESGLTGAGGSDEPARVVVIDPLDGSTNAALGLPWCATALCLVDAGLPQVAMVANLRTGDRYTAIRDRGARLDGVPISVGAEVGLTDAIIAVNARPPTTFRPAQYRSMGATALDIASVATSWGFDGSVDFDDDRIGVWDYLAAILIVTEAGGVAADAHGRDLTVLDPAARRRPVTAGSQALLDELLAAARAA